MPSPLPIATIVEKLQARFSAGITAVKTDVLDPWVEVAADQILPVCEFLKSDPELQFDSLNDLCGVDYFEPDVKKQAKYGHEPHLEVVYHLFSYSARHSLTLKVRLPRSGTAGADSLPELDSVAGVWSIADWHERECYDLVGIHFKNHPNLRRILCPEDWDGHPLRKDYEFPLEYHGIRGQ